MTEEECRLNNTKIMNTKIMSNEERTLNTGWRNKSER